VPADRLSSGLIVEWISSIDHAWLVKLCVEPSEGRGSSLKYFGNQCINLACHFGFLSSTEANIVYTMETYEIGG